VLGAPTFLLILLCTPEPISRRQDRAKCTKALGTRALFIGQRGTLNQRFSCKRPTSWNATSHFRIFTQSICARFVKTAQSLRELKRCDQNDWQRLQFGRHSPVLSRCNNKYATDKI
jgi:hypothetical protein